MRKQKWALILALLMVLTMVLAACGGGGDASPADGSTAEPAADGGDDAGGGDGDVELVYWSMWNETELQAQVIKEATDAFMADHPGVNIHIQWNGREIKKTLMPALEAGTVIDLWDEDLERVIKNWGQYAMPLDEFFEKDYPTTDGKPYSECVIPALQDIGRSFSEDGKLYAAPYQPMVVVTFYNRQMFTDAGIESEPTTWEEFDEACAKLVEAGYVPITFDDGYLDQPFPMHLARLKGVDFIKELVTDSTGEMWDDPAVLQAAKDYEDFASKGYFSELISSHVYPAAQYEVANGNACMYLLNGTWFPNEVRDVAEGIEWGAFSYPAVKGGDGTIYDNTYGSQAFQISKDCANAELAFEYIVYMTTGQWDEKMSVETIGAPINPDAEWPSEISYLKEILDNKGENYPWGCGFLDNADITAVMVTEFTRLCNGDINADEFVARMKTAATS